MAVTHEATMAASTIHVFHVPSSFLQTDTWTLSASSKEIRRVWHTGRTEISKEKHMKIKSNSKCIKVI